MWLLTIKLKFFQFSFTNSFLQKFEYVLHGQRTYYHEILKWCHKMTQKVRFAMFSSKVKGSAKTSACGTLSHAKATTLTRDACRVAPSACSLPPPARLRQKRDSAAPLHCRCVIRDNFRAAAMSPTQEFEAAHTIVGKSLGAVLTKQIGFGL